MKQVLAIALIAGVFAAPAQAGSGMLYKAVDSNGTVLFSDTPIAGANVTQVEQRPIPSGPAAVRTAAAVTEVQTLDGDAALARANEQVDLAEHALALARRNMWSANEGLKMQPTRTAPADAQRVEFYKKNLRTAQVYLAELVRTRQSQAVQLASNSASTSGAPVIGAPVMVAGNFATR